MGPLFSKKEGSKPAALPPRETAQVTSKDRAMLDLKVSRDRLKKYQKKANMFTGD
jgi:hypothetical protein